MRKKKVKRIIRRFKYIKGERKNILLNFRNNFVVTGCYLTMRYSQGSPFSGIHKTEECLAVPIRYKNKFAKEDVVLFDQTKSLSKSYLKKRKELYKMYFKILEITTQEFWAGIDGPFFIAFLDIKKLNNLEFLSAMNDLKKRGKK